MEKNTIFERHPRLYYSDGDVVLQAPFRSEKKAGYYELYRVHKAFLSRNSEAFANLFVDGNAGIGPSYDRQPLVELSDRAEDFSRLLVFLYNPSEQLTRRSDAHTASELAPTVRLADKYLLDALRASLIKLVVDQWPRTLQEWDVSESQARAIKASIRRRQLPEVRMLAECVPEPASAISFAQEFGCAEILPAAFYQLSRINVKEDFDLLLAEQHQATVYSRTGRLARWSLLDKGNLLRYLNGCTELEEYSRDAIMGQLEYGSFMSPICRPWWAYGDCPRPVLEDEKNRDEYPCFTFVERTFLPVWPEDEPRDPLRGLLDLVECYERMPDNDMDDRDGMCDQCQRELWRWITRQREELWRRLPEMFQFKLE
ncbi:hypothetical protein C8Q79DRAFT_1093573 [Trametes meyenii]|nr:hypothetical protein C8Q79DRAFT_1093573 [Trametes meyenii]